MIDGAKKVHSTTPGQNIDPISLVSAQRPAVKGFVVVSYIAGRTEAGEDGERPSRFYDLFFYGSSVLEHFARLTPDFRGLMDLRVGLQTFSVRRWDTGTQLRLYTAGDESLKRFMTTFVSEPSIRVELDRIDRESIPSLLLLSGCRKGIVECTDFSSAWPEIRLAEFSSNGQLCRLAPEACHGRLLVYDIEKNLEIYRHRYPNGWGNGNCHPWLKEMLSRLDDAVPEVRNAPPGGEAVPRGALPQAGRRGSRSAGAEEAPQGTDRLAEIPAMPPAVQDGETPDLFAGDDAADAAWDGPREAAPGPAQQPPARQEESPPPRTGTPENAPAEYLRQLDRLCRCFKKDLVDRLGSGSRGVLVRAEDRVRIVAPGFDSRALREEEALRTLDLILYAIEESPFYRRPGSAPRPRA